MVAVFISDSLILSLIHLILLVRHIKAGVATGQQTPSLVERVAILALSPVDKALPGHIEGVHLLRDRCAITLLDVEASLHKLLVSRVLVRGLACLLLVSHLKPRNLRPSQVPDRIPPLIHPEIQLHRVVYLSAAADRVRYLVLRGCVLRA